MSFEVLRDYFREIRKIPVLDPEEERKLIRRAQRGDEASKVKLVRSNLRLVVKIARRYERLGLPLSDLIEEGNIGLMKALNRFNVRLGYRFSTYASWWIRQHIIRAIANQSRVVRIPVYMSELLHKMRKASERLIHKYGRKPTNAELAKALKISLEKVQQLSQVSHRATSLDKQVSEDGEAEFIDLLQDDEIEAVDELVNLFKKEEIEALISMMDERSRKIIELRFGLKNGIPKTLAEVARRFGITRERVRQIEKEALENMRQIIASGQVLLKKQGDEGVRIENPELKTKKTKAGNKRIKMKQAKMRNAKLKLKKSKEKQRQKQKKKIKAKIKPGKVKKTKRKPAKAKTKSKKARHIKIKKRRK